MQAELTTRRGWFITFEGGEGAGKSTQVVKLKQRLEGTGARVVVSREPGGSPRAETIREFLLAGGAKPFGALAETMLFAAARADHVDQTIRPALEGGEVVLCDRFADSTRVYQGALAGVPTDTIATLEQLSVKGLKPDLTMILDIPTHLGLQRAEARRARLGQAPDRFEGQGFAYHDGIRHAFLALAEAEPDRCAVIDASRSEQEVAQAIWEVVTNRLVATRARHHVG